MIKKYTDYAVEKLSELTAIDSPTGYTKEATDWLMAEFGAMGFAAKRNKKGCVLVDIGGEGKKLGIAAHVDTLGAMVRCIKDNGRLRLTHIGGFRFDTADGENFTLHTRDGRKYTGVLLNEEPSVHVAEPTARVEDKMELLLDENVKSKEDVKNLGIEVGDFACADPRTVVTPSGYIKSRFLDDKASAVLLLALAKAVAEGEIKLNCHVYLYFTVYEEVGHGCCSGLPADLDECLSVDMGCIGGDLTCTELDVSICAQDAFGPYDYEMTSKLIALAKENKLSYAVDVYHRYSSDVDAALKAGYEFAHALIGPGVYASHNYERTHREGMKNTFALMKAYVEA